MAAPSVRRLPLLVALGALVVAVAVALGGALGSGRQTVTGWVVGVESRSLTDVAGFTLRTQDGRVLEFRVGPLELDRGGFPAGHLREHLALSQPVVVAWRDEGGQRIAVRLEDAPPTPQ